MVSVPFSLHAHLQSGAAARKKRASLSERRSHPAPPSGTAAKKEPVPKTLLALFFISASHFCNAAIFLMDCIGAFFHGNGKSPKQIITLAPVHPFILTPLRPQAATFSQLAT